jgi:hypothetical protein
MVVINDRGKRRLQTCKGIYAEIEVKVLFANFVLH